LVLKRNASQQKIHRRTIAGHQNFYIFKRVLDSRQAIQHF
jgi:hypothetical protein